MDFSCYFYYEIIGDLVSMIRHFERRSPPDNMARFYRLEVLPTLFGDWRLRRIWGRIGTRGRARAEDYPTRAAAIAEACRLERVKCRRGYVSLDVAE